MKKVILSFLSVLFTSGALLSWTQELVSPFDDIENDSIPLSTLKPNRYCGESEYPTRTVPKQQEETLSRQMMTLPEVLGVYIHVVKNDDGTSPGTDLDSVMMKFELMRELYAPHGICFILAGIGEIHNTDLDTQYYDLEESELNPYIKPDLLNIFIHDYLASYPGGSTSGGWAYAIPNSYFSWWELSVVDPNAMSVVAHEAGHCLGLYHTHEGTGSSNEENVARIGICRNCDTKGDLLCDTPADPNLSLNGLLSGCTYVGTALDNCGESYLPDPTNVMAYSPGSCQTNFTPGQGARMLDEIYTFPFLFDMILPVNIVFPSNLGFLFDSGEWFWLAKTFIHMESPSLVCSQTAKVTFVGGEEVTIGPGTTFAPTTGFVSVNVQNICH